MKKENKLSRWLLVAGVLLSFSLIITGRFVQDTYSIKVGQIAPRTLYAPREIQNKIATENKKEQVANSMDPQYEMNPLIEEEAKEDVDLLFKYVAAVQTEGVTQYDNADPIRILKAQSPISLYTEQYQMLLDLSEAESEELKQEILKVVAFVFQAGITNENQPNAVITAREEFEKTNLTAIKKQLGSEVVSAVMKPNMTINHDETQALIQETVDKLDPVIIMTGEKIVEQGTKISQETYEILKAAGYIKEEASKSIKRYIGAAIVVILLGGIFYGYMAQKRNSIALNNKEKSLLFVLYSLGILLIWTLRGIKFVYIPMTIVPMLVAILIHSDIAIILNMLIVIVGALIYKGDLSYLLYFSAIGIMSAISVINIRQRNRTLSIASYLGLGNALVIISIRLFTQGSGGIEFLKEGAIAFFLGILMLVIVVGSLPLWESVFDIVTPIKLLELTNPNQELLKRLLLEATGTYHHSLLVANLAEAAANAIGANPLLARVGGYYHDIGKLGYTNYYGENQISGNPHDHMEPALSAKIILSHVSRGEELATQYKLPKCVKDIIRQHHGTSLVQYFYVKASNDMTDDEVEKKDFQYKGPKPQTKEAAIVMLADVVEATVRSMVQTKKNDEDLEKIVAKIIRGKLEDGQLDESALMIQDLDKITKSFSRILVGMYHDRIAYPTKKEGVEA